MRDMFHEVMLQESFLMIGITILITYVLKSTKSREERYLEIIENYNNALSQLSKNIDFMMEKINNG